VFAASSWKMKKRYNQDNQRNWDLLKWTETLQWPGWVKFMHTSRYPDELRNCMSMYIWMAFTSYYSDWYLSAILNECKKTMEWGKDKIWSGF